MIRTTILALLLAFCHAAGAYATGLEISIGAWQQSLSGPLSYQALSDLDVIELDDDIVFDDEFKPLGRLKAELPLLLPNFYAVIAPMEFDGRGEKTINFNFGDTTFAADAALKSQITMNQYDFALYYGLPFVQTASAGRFNIDLGLNARVVDLEATISGRESGTGLNVEETQSLTVVVPMVYVALQIMPVDWLALEAEGRGIAVGDNHLLSVIGRVKYHFAGPAFAAAGYRLDNLEIDEDDLVVDLDFGGPFIELGIKF